MKFIFRTQVHFQNIQVSFVFQGYSVKVKVTGSKKRNIRT